MQCASLCQSARPAWKVRQAESEERVDGGADAQGKQ